MKPYESLEMEVILFGQNVDIITTSNQNAGDINLPDV